MKRNRTFLCLICLLVLLGFQQTAHAQHEPAVRLMMKLYCADNVCRVQPIGNGNGVIIGRSEQRLLIVTVAHNLRQVQEVQVAVAGRWYRANILERNEQIDLALLEVPGRFSVPAAEVAAVDPPDGASVLIDAYWPGNWDRRVIKTKRLPRRFERFLTLGTVVRPGVSGAGVVYEGELAGLVHGVTISPPVITLYVPGSVIYRQLIEWGYVSATSKKINEHGDFLVPNEKNKNLLTDHLLAERQRYQQELTDLKRQVELMSAELKSLSPLKNRHLILMNEGIVTSQKLLQPGDPIVLGSEIVIRKGADVSR